MENVIRECQLCGGKVLIHGYLKVKGYDIDLCRNCNLWFVDTKNIDSKALYADNYFQGAVYKDYTGEGDRKLRAFKSHLTLLNRYTGRKGNLLEIGCAAGFFLKVARDDGWSVKGIEVSEFAAEYGKNQFGLDVHCKDIDSLDFGENQYDAVAMWDVIEHLKDPFQVLRKIYRALRSDGVLFLTTGDTEGFNARIFGKNWFLLEPPYHLWYFSHRNLKNYAKKVGYKVLLCETDGVLLSNGTRNDSFHWKVMTHRLARRMFSRLGLGNTFYLVAKKA